MAIFARSVGKAVSEKARERMSSLQPYPTLETWRNPLTRGIARHFVNEAWQKTLNEIDFEYRLTDLTVENVPCIKYETSNTRESNDILFYVHSGGFVAGSARSNAAIILPVCHLTGFEGIGVDYTLLPEGEFPIPYDEIDAAYRSLATEKPHAHIHIVADSIGCALTLSNLLRWRDAGLSLPKSVTFIAPVIDGMGSSDTHKTNESFDPLLKSGGGKHLQRLFAYYAPGQSLKDPRVSPFYGEFHDLPPILVHVGTRDICLGESARFVEKALQNGVAAELRVYDGMFHLFHMFWSLNETRRAQADIARFIGQHASDSV